MVTSSSSDNSALLKLIELTTADGQSSNYWIINGNDLGKITTDNPTVTELNIKGRGISSITSNDFLNLKSKLPNLKILNISRSELKGFTSALFSHFVHDFDPTSNDSKINVIDFEKYLVKLSEMNHAAENWLDYESICGARNQNHFTYILVNKLTFVDFSSENDRRILLQVALDHPGHFARSCTGIGSSPIKFIKTIKDQFTQLLTELMRKQATGVHVTLLKMCTVVKKARSLDVSTFYEFKDYEDRLESAVDEAFGVRSMNSLPLLLLVLLPDDSENLVKVANGNGNSSSSSSNKHEEQPRHDEAHHILQDNGIISMCLNLSIKCIFSCQNVSFLIIALFHSSSRPRNDSNLAQKLTAKSDILRTLMSLHRLIEDARYYPAGMFFTKMISAVFLLWLTQKNFYLRITTETNKPYSIALYILIITNILYEIGRFQDMRWNATRYFSIWTAMNALSLLCLVWWMLSSWSVNSSSDTIGTWNSQVGLALSCILQSISLSQYLCLNESIGKLVIIIFAMVQDVLGFMVIFGVCVLGFGIAFEGLFNSIADSGFTDPWSTFQTLFQAIFGNFDFTGFDGSPFANFGIGIYMIFITFIVIILINLLIATMSNTYSRIFEHSLDEWGFLQVQLLSEHILFYERSPLSTLPPPLNAFTAPLAVVDVSKFIYRRAAFLYQQLVGPEANDRVTNVDITARKERRFHYSGTVGNIVLRLLSFPLLFVVVTLEILVNAALSKWHEADVLKACHAALTDYVKGLYFRTRVIVKPTISFGHRRFVIDFTDPTANTRTPSTTVAAAAAGTRSIPRSDDDLGADSTIGVETVTEIDSPIEALSKSASSQMTYQYSVSGALFMLDGDSDIDRVNGVRKLFSDEDIENVRDIIHPRLAAKAVDDKVQKKLQELTDSLEEIKSLLSAKKD